MRVWTRILAAIFSILFWAKNQLVHRMKKSEFEKNKFRFTLLYIIVPTQQRSNRAQFIKAFILFYNKLAYVGTV